jgi:hypothetical protein
LNIASWEDACIIDDQESHVVMTLRVPKEVIRKNLPLLRALAEMSGAPLWSTEPPAWSQPAEPEDLAAGG